MALHPLVQLALASPEDPVMFDQAATAYEESLYATKALTAQLYEMSHLPKEVFGEAMANPNFNWENYYSIRKPSKEELSLIAATICRNLPVNSQSKVSTKALLYFSSNHLEAVLSQYPNLALEILRYVLRLPIEETNSWNIWNKLTPDLVLGLYLADFVTVLPANIAIKQTPLYREINDLFVNRKLPTSFGPLQFLGLLEITTHTDIKNLVFTTFIESNADVPTDLPGAVWRKLLPYILGCIEKESISVERILAFYPPARRVYLEAEDKTLVLRILSQKRTCKLLQEGLPSVAFLGLSLITPPEYISFKDTVDLTLFEKNLDQLIPLINSLHRKESDQILDFLISQHPNTPFVGHLITALSVRNYPLAYLHLPIFKTEKAVEALLTRFSDLSANHLSNLLKHRPNLIQELWKKYADEPQQLQLLKLCKESHCKLPLNWAKTICTSSTNGNATVLLQLVLMHPSLTNRSKYLRVVAYAYAAKHMDLSCLFKEGSPERHIIKRIMVSTSLKSK